jgi:uroporphyrinogen-III decarboxylase
LTRDLFLKIMNFKPHTPTLNWEFGYWGGAIKRWYKEGLPKIKGLPRKITFGDSVYGQAIVVGPSYKGEEPTRDYDVSKYFDFDKGFELVPYNYWVYPKFKKKIVYEDERFIEFYDFEGIRKKIFKDNSSMPAFLEWPVKTKKDWEEIKDERFDLNTIDRRFIGDKKKIIEKYKKIDAPLVIIEPPAGFFGSLRYLIGEENLFILYYDNPKLVHEILDHLCNLWIAMAEELTSVFDFDLACFWEDMSGSQGSFISPEMFREFMTPRYRKIIDLLKSKGVNLFFVDTDGYVEDLIPLFLESGINGMYPFEQQAGNDLIKIRKNYPELRIIGGFNKNILSKSINEIDLELEKMSYLIRKGGYIPTADHHIPPDVPWENFRYYRKRLKEIIDFYEVTE